MTRNLSESPLLTAAVRLSAMPALLGAGFVLLGYGDSASPLGVAGPWLSLLLAWVAFIVTAGGVAAVVGLVRGTPVRLQTQVACPACGALSPVYCLRCTRCRHHLGVPEASRATYSIAMAAYAVFVAVFFARLDRW